MLPLIVWLAVSAVQAPTVPVPSGEEALRTLRPAHPRLIALPDDLARVKRLTANECAAADVYKAVQREADKFLKAAPIQHRLIGPRLLDQSRTCLLRVYTLATLYRIQGDRRYADRAIREMLTAAAFPDWNPKHFLDTAEMTHALAIGYDWLYQELSADERVKIRDAIVTMGLREAEKVYRKGGWWAKSEFNWNQVCNGGITLGALAVAEDEPQLAAYIVGEALKSIQIAMHEYAPDGGWAEGPGYWSYATSYNVYFLAGLESALGTDFGLSRLQGFSAAGDFFMHCIGPTRLSFNFADASDSPGGAPCMDWLARKFNRPQYAWHERDQMLGRHPLDLWWFQPQATVSDNTPTDRCFQHIDVAFLRSNWNDRRAVFVGFKGGDNGVNHSHLQLGSFILDADGQRWVLQLGPDDYNLPGYFGKQRWSYYRLSTAGQNTLLIDGQNQDPKAVAPITAFHSAPDRAHAVADLSAAYARQADRVTRGIALLGRRQVLVQDELVGARGQITWQIHTKAKIDLDRQQAVLHLNDETLHAQILSPRGAKFAVEPATAPPPQRQQPDVQKLIVRLPASSNATRIAVLFIPSNAAGLKPSPIVPLARWPRDR
jgi:hypothetical protein